MPQPFLLTAQRGFVALALLALLGCAPNDSDIMPAATTQSVPYRDGTYTAMVACPRT